MTVSLVKSPATALAAAVDRLQVAAGGHAEALGHLADAVDEVLAKGPRHGLRRAPSAFDLGHRDLAGAFDGTGALSAADARRAVEAITRLDVAASAAATTRSQVEQAEARLDRRVDRAVQSGVIPGRVGDDIRSAGRTTVDARLHEIAYVHADGVTVPVGYSIQRSMEDVARRWVERTTANLSGGGARTAAPLAGEPLVSSQNPRVVGDDDPLVTSALAKELRRFGRAARGARLSIPVTSTELPLRLAGAQLQAVGSAAALDLADAARTAAAERIGRAVTAGALRNQITTTERRSPTAAAAGAVEPDPLSHRGELDLG